MRRRAQPLPPPRGRDSRAQLGRERGPRPNPTCQSAARRPKHLSKRHLHHQLPPPPLPNPLPRGEREMKRDLPPHRPPVASHGARHTRRHHARSMCVPTSSSTYSPPMRAGKTGASRDVRAGIKKAASHVAGGLTSGSRDRVLDRSLLSQPQTAARARIKAPAFLTRHVGYETNHERIMPTLQLRRQRFLVSNSAAPLPQCGRGGKLAAGLREIRSAR